MSLRDRLLMYIEFKGIDKAYFERLSNLSNGFVDKSGDNTRYSSLDKISKAFPDLNMAWLRTGQGKMILDTGDIEEEIGSPELDKSSYALNILAKAIDKLADSEKNNSENVKELIAQGRQQTDNMTKLIDLLLQNGVAVNQELNNAKKGDYEGNSRHAKDEPYQSTG